jgi:(5-formylfuran-3-yl)methyl phosphate synthase
MTEQAKPASPESDLRTRLLVSVRNAAEAEAAYAGGADLIDIKEPWRGSLGRAEPRVWRDIVHVMRDRCPLSVALGELVDGSILSSASRASGVQYAKVGLSGVRGTANWRTRWRGVARQLKDGIEPVAVIYADWQKASAPSPSEILCQAADIGCRIALVDTFMKRGGSLFQVLSPYQLRDLVDRVRDRRLGLVLAGSLAETDFPRVLALQPDWIAVRGSACIGGRRGAVSAERVRRLSSHLE